MRVSGRGKPVSRVADLTGRCGCRLSGCHQTGHDAQPVAAPHRRGRAMTGSCTSTSTSSSPRSRSCGAPSSPAGRSSSGGDGDPTRPRQVVATASYEARAFGVRSGMPLRTAARRCPDAVFLPSDRPAYEAASARVMATLRSLAVVVEEWGWDEAFVGVRTRRPRGFARHVQARVLAGRGCAARSGSARPSCRPRPRPASPSPAASPASPGTRGCRRWATSR